MARRSSDRPAAPQCSVLFRLISPARPVAVHMHLYTTADASSVPTRIVPMQRCAHAPRRHTCRVDAPPKQPLYYRYVYRDAPPADSELRGVLRRVVPRGVECTICDASGLPADNAARSPFVPPHSLAPHQRYVYCSISGCVPPTPDAALDVRRVLHARSSPAAAAQLARARRCVVRCGHAQLALPLPALSSADAAVPLDGAVPAPVTFGYCWDSGDDSTADDDAFVLRFEAADGTCVATAAVMRSVLMDASATLLTLPLLSPTFEVLGHMWLSYVVISGLPEHDVIAWSSVQETIRDAPTTVFDTANDESVGQTLALRPARMFWKSTHTVDVGHRGSGAHGVRGVNGSRTMIAENTVLSFNLAAQNGLQFIEFDVQLTRDRVPVIWHDFFLHSIDDLKIDVYDMTFQQFKKFTPREYHANDKTIEETAMKNGAKCQETKRATIRRSVSTAPLLMEQVMAWSEQKLSHTAVAALQAAMSASDQHTTETIAESLSIAAQAVSKARRMSDTRQIAPIIESPKSPDDSHVIRDVLSSLRAVFKNTPPELGFDIELKYPSDYNPRRGLVRSRFPPRNVLVDAVLHVVMSYASQNRRIFFSSFDPDVCLMLHLKQPVYPVFLLTESGAKQWNQFDWRRASLGGAIAFCCSFDLMGIISRATPIIDDPALVDLVKANNLLLGTFGHENNEIENVEMQENKRVDMVVSDHMGTHVARKQELKRRQVIGQTDAIN